MSSTDNPAYPEPVTPGHPVACNCGECLFRREWDEPASREDVEAMWRHDWESGRS